MLVMEKVDLRSVQCIPSNDLFFTHAWFKRLYFFSAIGISCNRSL